MNLSDTDLIAAGAKRVERIGDAVLILGDCREIAPLIQADAVVSDPPYGIEWAPRVNHRERLWRDDEDIDLTPWLSVGTHHLFWGGQYFAASLPRSESWLTWIKRPVDMNFHNDARSYATTELAWCDWGKAGHFVHVWDGGMRQGAAENRTFCHPSQKPVELMEWCIGRLPRDRRIICDPYMGSATTGVAAAKLGRAFVGIEREPAYFDTACRRIAEAARQPSLFDAAPQPKPTQLDLTYPVERMS